MGSDRRRVLRVLCADDSAVMRGILKTVFDLHRADGASLLPAMELCGLAKDGVEALEEVARLRPDVLLLDMEMPRLSGLGVLERLRKEAPGLPVIMCSAHTERGARSTLEGLAAGAKDYVMKPGQQRDFAAALDSLMGNLLPRIAALAGDGGTAQTDVASAVPGRLHPIGGARVELVVIGVSTGGPSALEAMLPTLTRDFSVPILIVQHMPKLFTGALAQRLDKLCRLKVAEASHGAEVTAGKVWLAPGDAHMEVAVGLGGQAFVRLHQETALNSCKPSVEYLFRSAAKAYGAGALAVMMTGMGSDGVEGARQIRDAGGAVLAQDQASSAVWGMPGKVVEAGLASDIVPLGGLAAALTARVQGWGGAARPMSAEALSAARREVNYGVL